MKKRVLLFVFVFLVVLFFCSVVDVCLFVCFVCFFLYESTLYFVAFLFTCFIPKHDLV